MHSAFVCKMSTKDAKIIKKRHFMIFLDNSTQEYKATKKQIVRLQLNEKKLKESQTISMS